MPGRRLGRAESSSRSRRSKYRPTAPMRMCCWPKRRAVYRKPSSCLNKAYGPASALGPQTFKEDVGYFWGMIETRPYMRARAGLASCLWQLGERQVAIDHYVDMLRLNPGDNQGIRYVLANCLLRQGDDVALTKLLAAFKDDAMAEWPYTRALLAFRREGAGKQADAALKKALKQNAFVPAYLLGKQRLPRQLPGYIGFGDQNEAVSYAAEALDIWRHTPGALEWLASNLSDV
jgi:tetratricopeptide (TPR) repeat protein